MQERNLAAVLLLDATNAEVTRTTSSYASGKGEGCCAELYVSLGKLGNVAMSTSLS